MTTQIDDLRPERRERESTIDYCARLPRRRWNHTAKGKILELPQSGMIVVPYEQTDAGWYVVVVRPDPAGIYQPGGYSLYIGAEEIETAIEHALGEETNLEDRKIENPNSRFKGLADKITATRKAAS